MAFHLAHHGCLHALQVMHAELSSREGRLSTKTMGLLAQALMARPTQVIRLSWIVCRHAVVMSVDSGGHQQRFATQQRTKPVA